MKGTIVKLRESVCYLLVLIAQLFLIEIEGKYDCEGWHLYDGGRVGVKIDYEKNEPKESSWITTSATKCKR